MKKSLFILSFVAFFSTMAFAADTTTVYLSCSLNVVKKKQAHYIGYTLRNLDGTWFLKCTNLEGNVLLIGNYSSRRYSEKHGSYQEFYENGHKKEEGNYDEGIITGDWNFYHENGSLKAAGNYSRVGRREGKWKYYHDNGSLESFGEFVKDQKTGEWSELYANGNKKSEGTYNTEGKKIGVWKFYHENGSKKESGEFRNDKRYGEWTGYYDNAQIEYSGGYANGGKVGQWIGFKKDGRDNYKSFYNKLNKLDGEFVMYGSEGMVFDTGTYENGTRVGDWEFNFNSGKPSARVTYQEGEITKAVYFSEDGDQVDPNKTTVNRNAVFPGGEAEMYKYLGNQMKYPAEARDKGIQGRVYVSFIVAKDGSIGNVKILRGQHKSIDDEALRVIKSMPNWEPAIDMNRIVRVRFNLPLLFKLQ